jgi:hypothetical protein
MRAYVGYGILVDLVREGAVDERRGHARDIARPATGDQPRDTVRVDGAASGAASSPMGDVRLICLDADDLMHENTGETNYNESAYYNFYDPKQRLGGFVRIGNRANEGYAEMTCCLYLPDGRVGFMFARPKIPDNSKFDAAGMRFTVTAPMREHCDPLRRQRLPHGAAARPDRSEEGVHVEPARAGVDRAHVHGGIAGVRAASRASSATGQWVSVKTEKTGQEFAKGHLEQHGRAVGRVVVDGTEWAIDGYGLRDRSWGPRYWQAPDHYRWLTMNFGQGAGIAAARTVQRDGRAIEGGYIYTDGAPNRYVGKVEVDTGLRGRREAACRASRARPSDGRRRARGDHGPRPQHGAAPQSAERRDDAHRRGLTEWRWGDRVGYGWSEYLDHVG